MGFKEQEDAAGGYEVGKSGSYPAYGQSPDRWNQEEYAAHWQRILDRAKRSAAGSYARLIGDTLSAPANYLEKNIGGNLARTLDDLDIWHPAWDDPHHREFMWHNVPFMGSAAYWPIAIAKAAYQNPGLTAAGALTPLGMGQLTEKAQEIWDQGHESFGRRHPEATDQIVKLFGADPILWFGPMVNMAKAPGIARDLSKMADIIRTAREADTAGERVLAVTRLAGAEPTDAVLKAILNKGNTPEQAAQALYSHGMKPVAPGEEFGNPVRMPYFRRASELVAPELRDLVKKWPAVKDAAWLQHKQAIEAWKDAGLHLDPEDIKDVQRILHNVHSHAALSPKEAGNAIRSEMAQAIASGEWAGDATKGRQLSYPGTPNPDNPTQAALAMTHEPSAGAIEAAAIYRELTKAGHVAEAPFMTNYAKGFSAPPKGIRGFFPRAGQPGWWKPRQSGVDIETSFQDLQKWAYRVFMREDVMGVPAGEAIAENWQGRPVWMEKYLNRKLDNALEALSGIPKPDLMQAPALTSFQAEIEKRLGRLKALGYAAKQGGDLERARGYEQAIIETKALSAAVLDIGKKNPEVMEDASKMEQVLRKALAYVRMGQTTINPGWLHSKHLDGMARNVLTTGELHGDYGQAFLTGHAPVRGIDGELMDFTHRNAKYQSLDVPETGFKETLNRWSENVDGYHQQVHGGLKYNERVKFYTEQGLPKESIHGLAKQDALESVRKTFPDYSDSSKFLDDLAPYFMYLKHHILYNAMPILSWAAKNPSEAVFAQRALKLQYTQLAANRFGDVRVPGTEVGVNPEDPFTARRIARLAADPTAVIPEADAQAAKAFKFAQVFTGEPIPPLHAATRLAGLEPEHSPDTHIPALQVLDAAARYFTGEDTLGVVKHMAGSSAPETPDVFRDQQIKSYMAAQQLEGKPVTYEQARDKVDSTNLADTVLGYGTGVRLKLMTPGMVELHRLQDRYKEIVEQHGRVGGEKMLDDVPEIRGTFNPQTDIKMIPYSTMDKLHDAEEWQRQAPKLLESPIPVQNQMLKSAPSGVYEKLLDLWNRGVEAVKKEVVFQGGDGTASAAEITPGARLVKKGGTFTTEDQKMSKDDYSGSVDGEIKFISGLNTDTRTKLALQDVDRAPSNAEVIRRVEQYDQAFGGSALSNWIKDPENQKRDVSISRMANVLVDPNTHDGPLSVYNARKQINAAVKDWVARGGLDAEGRQTMSPEAVRTFVTHGKLTAEGFPPTAWDDPAIKEALQLAASSVTTAHIAYQRQVKQDYPGNDLAHAMLRTAVADGQRGDTQAVPTTVQNIKDHISAGDMQISPDFWKDLMKHDATTFSNASVLMHAEDIKSVGTFISKIDSKGHFYGIDLPRLVTAMEEPGGNAAIAALREHGSPQVKAGLDAAAPAYEQATGRALSTDAPHDPFSMGQFFLHPFAVGVGLEPNHWSVGLDADTTGNGPTKALDAAGPQKAHLDLNAAGGLHAPLTGQALETKTTESDLPGGAASSGGAPSLAGAQAEPIKEAALASDFGQAPLINQMRSGADLSIPHFTETSIPVQTQMFRSVGSYITATANQYHAAETAWQSKERAQPGSGGPRPSLMDIGIHNLTMPAQAQDAYGNPVASTGGDPTGAGMVPTLNIAQIGGAVDTLAGAADKLGVFGMPGSDTERAGSAAVGGLGMALGVHGALAALAPVAIGAGPAGWAVAAGIGVFAGLQGSGFFGGKSDRTQEMADMARDRAAERAAAFAETQRRNDVTTLVQRESALASKAGGALSAQQRAQIQPQLAAFQRRPTFQSRIGLADSAERAIGSAIHPRW